MKSTAKGCDPFAPTQTTSGGIRYQIARQDPRALVVADGEATGNMGQGHVGYGRVKQFHKRRQRYGDGDNPGIDGLPLGGGVSDGNGRDCRAHVLEPLFSLRQLETVRSHRNIMV